MEGSKIKNALIATVLLSAGGSLFLEKNSEPTLRDVYLACEKGELSGLVCCEDLRLAKDSRYPLATCGMITPENKDPFGIRKQLEDEFDKALKGGN